jgi:hypothetical protein
MRQFTPHAVPGAMQLRQWRHCRCSHIFHTQPPPSRSASVRSSTCDRGSKCDPPTPSDRHLHPSVSSACRETAGTSKVQNQTQHTRSHGLNPCLFPSSSSCSPSFPSSSSSPSSSYCYSALIHVGQETSTLITNTTGEAAHYFIRVLAIVLRYRLQEGG